MSEEIIVPMGSKRNAEHKLSIGITLPRSMLEEVERLAKESSRTRNDVIRIVLEQALLNAAVVKAPVSCKDCG